MKQHTMCAPLSVREGVCWLVTVLIMAYFFYARQPENKRPVLFAPLVLPHEVVSPAAGNRGSPSSIPRFPLFLIHQQNLDMLRNAFQSAQEAFPNQIVIIDNSHTTELAADPDFAEAAAYYHTVTLLNFPQIQNLIAALSSSWNFSFYGWIHEDGVVLKREGREQEDISIIVEDQLKWMKNWGVAFVFYDILAFYNTEVVLKHPWDENYLQNYMADCDAYQRWRLAGLSTDKLSGIDDHLQVVHMGSVPSKTWAAMSPEQRREAFPALEKSLVTVDANFWKRKYTSIRSSMSQAGRYEAALRYFQDKWASSVTEVGCKIGGLDVKPAFEVEPSVLSGGGNLRGGNKKEPKRGYRGGQVSVKRRPDSQQ